MTLYDQLLDKDIVFKINEVFYDKVYKHPWMSLYFKDVSEEFITMQQTNFIIGSIGGPKQFSGRMPSNAHPHMYITDELFNLRKALLMDAMEEVRAPQELRDAWLKIDEAFRGVIVKKSLDDCEKRFNSDTILAFENPEKSMAGHLSN